MSYSVNTTPYLEDFESGGENAESENHIRDNNAPLFKLSEPPDKYYMAYVIFYLLGMVTLLPWNFFITANDYWIYKFREVNTTAHQEDLRAESNKTSLQASFTSYISVASSVPAFIFLLLNTALSHRISLNVRVIVSLLFMQILFIVTLVLVNINTDQWQNTFFAITITTIVLLNVCSAVLSGSIFGVIGRFCPIYITATIGGQALGGIFAAVAQIISLSAGASPRHSAFIYFIIGNVTILISIISYAILTKTNFYRFHLYEKFQAQNGFDNELIKPTNISHKEIFKKIWTHGLSMFGVYAITLSVYPSVTVLVESEGKGHGNKWNDVFFVPTIAYLLFSIGDYLGRVLAGIIQKPKNGYVLLISSGARFIFIPLLMLCNAQPRVHHWPVAFPKDYEYIFILTSCALTNGYMTNLNAITAPKVVETHEKEVASSMMSVFLGLGLAVGSAISLFMVQLL